jgi:hypothetical protein
METIFLVGTGIMVTAVLLRQLTVAAGGSNCSHCTRDCKNCPVKEEINEL